MAALAASLRGARLVHERPMRARDLTKLGGRLERWVSLQLGAALGASLASVPSSELEGFAELDELSTASGNSGHALNLEAASTYVLVLQVVAASAAVVTVTLILPYLSLWADHPGSLRSLAAGAAAGAALALKPATILFTPPPQRRKDDYTTTPASLHLFRSLRLAVGGVVLTLCCEALLYTQCPPDDNAQPVHVVVAEATRGLLEFSCVIVLALAAAHRAWRPAAALDATVVVSLGALGVLALLCAPRAAPDAPLLRCVGGAEAVARICRTLAFSTLYCGTVLASAPRHIARAPPALLCARGVAAAAWTLVVEPSWLLLLAPIQLIVLLLRRVSQLADEESDDDEPRHQATRIVGEFNDSASVRSANSSGSLPERAAEPGDERRERLQRILATGHA